MRPLRLELEGFTSFRERTEVSFEDTDLFVFTGATGSGKSSLIDAMIFALYGSVPRYDNKNLIAPVISQGKVRARVRLDFETRGKIYTAVRVVQRTAVGATTKEARLEERRNGGPARTLAATEASLSASVETDVIGLGLDHFTKCVVLPQGEFAAFLRAKPGDRKQLLERLLGLGLYEKLRLAAHLRWKEEESREGQLRSRLESALVHATPEAVREAEARVTVLDELGKHIDEVSTDLRRLATAIRKAREGWDKAAGRLELLAEVRVPEGTAELATRHADAEEELRRTSEARDAAADRLLAARAARDELPERAEMEKFVDKRRDLARLEKRIGNSRNALGKEAEASARATRDEKAVREDHEDARASLERLPARAELESVREARRQLREQDREVERSRNALAGAEEEYTAAARAKTGADLELEAATQVLEDLRVAHGAVDMAHHLEEGKPCPVCLRNVLRLPDHDVPADLDAARARKRAAEDASRRARTGRDRKGKARVALATALEHKEQSAESLRERVSGKPANDEIDVLLREIGKAEDSVRSLERRVEEAGRRRAGCEARLKAANATLDQRKHFAADLRADLDDAPTPEEVSDLLERIRVADRLLKQGQREEKLARRTHHEAEEAFKGWVERLTDAWSQYQATRDRVAEVGPPGAGDRELSHSWFILSQWAERTYAETEELLARLNAEVERASGERSRLDRDLRERCRSDGLSLEEDDDPATKCAAAMGAADQKLSHLRRDAAEREEVERKAQNAHERAMVAKDLGGHLNARNFGAWLQNQILGWLVQGATDRLRQLSSGQYSLDLSNKNEFLVIDHRNADEPRLAKTLSGGETFLASLALALSLAEQVANLAAHGSAKLEALFLDEGFGTLDSETLDVVAATIEQLGTERMVGVVTHVSELADRIPVQYRVKKVGNSSSVERLEA